MTNSSKESNKVEEEERESGETVPWQMFRHVIEQVSLDHRELW